MQPTAIIRCPTVRLANRPESAAVRNSLAGRLALSDTERTGVTGFAVDLSGMRAQTLASEPVLVKFVRQNPSTPPSILISAMVGCA